MGLAGETLSFGRLAQVSQESKTVRRGQGLDTLGGYASNDGVTFSDAYSANWRPSVGWVCVLGLLWQFVIAPVLTWAALFNGKTFVAPPLDTTNLIALLVPLLGMGVLRTVEKVQGVSANPSDSPAPSTPTPKPA